MKKFILIFPLHFLFSLNAQQFSLMQTIKYSDITISTSLASDNAGNIYMSGHFKSSSGTDQKGIFLYKYSSNNDLIWKDTVITDLSTSDLTGLAVDRSGCAYFSRAGNVKFESQIYQGNHLLKFDPLGKVQWLINSSPGFNVALDNSESVYLASNNIYKYNSAGECLSNIGVTKPGNISIDNNANFFLVTLQSVNKHDPFGSLLWSFPAMVDSRIALDASGNCYVSETGSDFISPLTKLDPAGKVMWTIDLPFYGAFSLYCDANNDIYIIGLCGADQLIEAVEVRKINGDGSTLWSYKLPDSDKLRPTGIIESNGILYMSATRAFSYDARLFKIDPKASPDLIKSIQNSKEDYFSIFPNPSRGIFAVSRSKPFSSSNLSIDIYDVNGKNVYAKNFGSPEELYEIIDLSDFPGGIYSLEVCTDKCYETKKLIVE